MTYFELGGRLKNSNLPFKRQRSMILPTKHNFTNNTVINHYHMMYFHAGAQLTLSVLPQRFWIVSEPSEKDFVELHYMQKSKFKI